nr:uncharacterized mitochondrial protein AtMg00810-like [Tanacetum cinerariifolium]
MYDKKNSVLFTETECLVLSPSFKLLDESQVMLRVSKQSNMYSFDLKNVVPSEDLSCLFAKASIDESNIWHMRLGHVNFKTMNKLINGYLVRGLPSKIFNNDHSCVAYQKEKQQIKPPVKPNLDLDEFCGMKGIKREYSKAKTPQQNRVAERKNRTFIEATRTMLADSLLHITFWAEAVNTACYVLNKFLQQTDKNAGPQDTNGNAGTQDNVDTRKEMSDQYYIVLPLWSSISSTYKSLDDKPADDKPKDDTGSKTIEEPVNKEDQAYKDELDRLMSQEKEVCDAADALRKEFEQGCMDHRGVTQAGSTNSVNTVSNLVNAASTSKTFSAAGPSYPHLHAFIPPNTLLHVDQDDSQIPNLEETAELQSTGIFNSTYDDDLTIYTSPVQSVGAEAEFNNMESSTIVSPIPTHKVHIDHPKDQILGDPKLAVETRGMAKKSSGAHAFVSYIHKQRRTNNKDYENCLFACFLLQMEHKKVKQSKEGIFISQDKYVTEILKKFYFSSIKTASTPIETLKPLVKDEVALDVDVHLYRSMIGSLMYLTASRPDIMFAVCACSRDSPFDLEAYSDSDYAGANLDRKSTTGGCQFLGRRLISWQCKKQTIVATSTTKEEYVATAHCCGQ